MLKNIFISIILCLLLGACSSKNLSQEEINRRHKELSTPNEGHRLLDPLIGEWTAHAKFWTNPDQLPKVSRAKVSREWVLGGRYIREEYHNLDSKDPFSGIGMLGYSIAEQHYVSTWYDTMSTNAWTSFGKINETGDVIHFYSQGKDPYTDKPNRCMSILTIVDNDTNLFEMFDIDTSGELKKTIKIRYKRS